MNGDEIGFGDVSDVHRNERRSKVLTKLPTNFYARAEEHLQALRAECRTSNPDLTNPKTMMLQDQISKLDKRLKQIYEIRERKIALAALDRMLGAPQPDNMTKRDRALYDRLCETLTAFRQGVEAQLPPEPAQPAAVAEQKPAEAIARQQAPCIPEPAVAAPQPPSPAEENIVVQVLEDIPTFVGVNVTYDLRKDEMVTLPSQFANLLLSRGKVRFVGS